MFVSVILTAWLNLSAQERLPELMPQSGHAAAVSALAPFGEKFFLSGDRLGNVILWNSETARQIRNFSGLNREIQKITVSPDGKLIASLSADGSAMIWEAQTGERIKEFAGMNDFRYADIAFADERNIYLSTFQGGLYTESIFDKVVSSQGLKVWARLDDREKRTGSSLFSVKDSIWVVLVKPDDGNELYQKIESYSLSVHHFRDRSKSRTYNFSGTAPGGLRISQDERYAAVSQEGKIYMLDAAEGIFLTTIETASDTIIDFVLSSDGVYLAVQQTDSTVGIWNQITQKSAGQVTAPQKFISSLMISPDRKYIYAGIGTGEILQFDFRSFKPTKEFTSTMRFLTAMDFFGEKNGLVAGSLIQGVNILHPDGKVIEISSGNEGFLYTLVSPDEKVTAGINEKRIVLWDTETGKEIQRRDKNTGEVNSAAFSPDGSRIYLAQKDSSLLIYSLAEGSFARQGGFKGEVFHLAISPDGKTISLADQWNKFSIYDSRTFELIRTLGPHDAVVYSSGWSPDGSRIATSAEDSSVYIWNSSTGELLTRIKTDHLVVTDVKFSPDGKKLGISAVGGAVYVYETTEWKRLYKFDNTGVYVGFIDFSTDSRLLAGTTATGQLRIWNTETGREEFTFTAFNKTDWSVTLPDGRFDASQEGMKLLHFVKGYDVIPLESFFNENYFPSLAGEVLSGTITPLTETEIKDKFLFKLPPEVKISAPARDVKLRSGKNLFDIESLDRGGGIKWIRLFVNGKLAAEQDFSARAVTDGEKLSLVMEAELLPDTNQITVVASSLNGIESLPVSENYFVQGSKPRSKLYIVGIGINEYLNPVYNLQSAVSDITILADKFKKGAAGYTSAAEEYLLFNENAGRSEILRALDSVALKARPQDIFLLLYSGHGVFQPGMKGTGDFYFVLHDMDNMYAGDSASLAKGISASELREYSRRIAANKQLLIIDACQAGGAVEVFAMRGVAEEKAIQSLARSSGMFLLASSARNSAAKELKPLGMGIYSYALSEALSCMGDFDKDGVLLVKEMEFYARRKLEEVQKKYKLTPQYPMSWMMYQDFPVSVCE